MTKEQWKVRILDSCRAAGTYRPFFDSAIDTLADILETRDKARKQFEDGGSLTTTRGSNGNLVKNPALTTMLDLNAKALAYWRDLGLTPAGYKKLNEQPLRAPDEKKTLSDVLAGLGI